MKKNEQQLSELLEEFSKKKSVRKKLNQHRIEEAWRERMGKTVDSYTSEIRLSRSKLYVSIRSAPLRQELHQKREDIVQMLNDLFDEQVIEEIIFR